ncbi:MAG: ATP synthase F1 subunit gamma [Candidatus Sumerlaeia bacterium]
MAENLKQLRRRIRSVRNTRQITRAMEMVSAAKLRRTSVLFEAAQPYSLKMRELLGRVITPELMETHPLFQVRPIRRVLLIVFTADKGLCGAFNANLIARAEKFLAAQPAAVETDLLLIGRKGWDYFRRRRHHIVKSITNLSGRPDSEAARQAAALSAEQFISGVYDRVHVIYAEFVNKMVNRPREDLMLPLAADALGTRSGGPAPAHDDAAGSGGDYIIEPDPATVFDSLIPRYLQGRMYGFMVETFTCEHSARMVAMTNATRNCKELIDSLTLKMNKARQNAITKELLDIVGGAQAVQ